MATNPPTLLRLGLARALRSASSRSTTTRLFTTPSHAPRHRPTTTTTTTTTTSVTSATTTQNPTSPLPNPHRSISSSRTTNPPARPTHPPKTDFAELDVLANTPTPSTAVDVCYADGFALNSGVRITGGDGALLVGGEAFSWRPWEAVQQGGRLVNGRGQWEVGEEGFAVFGGLWPRPDLLILGLGPEIRPLSPATRRAIGNLGMRVEVLDTRNAAAQYNLLATERGVEDVAAALIPIGWREGVK